LPDCQRQPDKQPSPVARSVLLLQGKFFGTSDVDLENRFILLRNPDAHLARLPAGANDLINPVDPV